MREIKFRAWDRRLKLMFNNSEIIIKNSKVTHLKDKEFFSIEYDPIYKVELMQYTGLKDKNGKEIYDGDIIEVKLDRSKFFDDIAKVIFKKGCFILQSVDFEDETSELIKSEIYLEIIGNIYENPELLESV